MPTIGARPPSPAIVASWSKRHLRWAPTGRVPPRGWSRHWHMDGWQGSRVLVVGAAGFIGANLMRELIERGAAVHGIVRPSTDRWRIEEIVPRLTLHHLDLTDQAALAR